MPTRVNKWKFGLEHFWNLTGFCGIDPWNRRSQWMLT
jgi:hypothetical protein